ncbi:MAG: alpha/beta hydrolase [Clostridia bacterium]|nr:alpha/beta hydrolase [Clostridia bacterium]
MFEKLKAKILFDKLLSRPDISKAYKMVDETDSWYQTIKTVHESLAQIKQYPSQTWQVTSTDNLLLQGIYYPAQTPSNTTVLCIHGYTSHAEREWAFPGLFYKSFGYNVLIPYQRAHGPSQGKFISFGVMEADDMAHWVDKINAETPNGNIIIHGLSMGGCIALLLAARNLQNVACIIADAPSIGVCEMFKNVSNAVFKSNQEKIANYCNSRFQKVFGVAPQDYNIFTTVRQSKYPILLAAGSNEHLEELFEALKKLNPQPTQTVILDGCNHGNGMYKQTGVFQGAIKSFVNCHLHNDK